MKFFDSARWWAEDRGRVDRGGGTLNRTLNITHNFDTSGWKLGREKEWTLIAYDPRKEFCGGEGNFVGVKKPEEDSQRGS